MTFRAVHKTDWTPEQLARLRAGAAAGEGDRSIAAALGKTSKAVNAKRQRLGLSMQGRKKDSRPCPSDFAEKNSTLGEMAQRKLYGCGGPMLERWRKELGLGKPEVVARRGPPVGGKQKRVVTSAPKVRNFGPKMTMAPVDGSYAAQAARYLMRDYKPVCRRATVEPKADKDLWIVGRNTMTSAEMIAKAEARGFNARLAA